MRDDASTKRGATRIYSNIGRNEPKKLDVTKQNKKTIGFGAQKSQMVVSAGVCVPSQTFFFFVSPLFFR